MSRTIKFSALILFAIVGVARAQMMEPHFRVWRSSALQGGDYNFVQLSSEPIIFHTVIGSPTVNQAGNSFFSIMKSSLDIVAGMFVGNSTAAYIPLDTTMNGQGMTGNPYDIYLGSHTYYTKKGGAVINILWDYYRFQPNYTTGGDTQR